LIPYLSRNDRRSELDNQEFPLSEPGAEIKIDKQGRMEREVSIVMQSTLKKLLVTFILCGALAAGYAQAKREPLRAVLYSAAFPGGGQLYNRAWLKAGLVMGVQGFFIGSAIYHGSQENYWQDLAENTADQFLQEQYLALSRAYRYDLNNDLWWIGITAGLSMLDAYVDAHLSDFESEKEKLRLRFSGNALLLQYRF